MDTTLLRMEYNRNWQGDEHKKYNPDSYKIDNAQWTCELDIPNLQGTQNDSEWYGTK